MEAQEKKQLKIAVAGAGYVGLTLAVLLARQHKVYVMEVVAEKAAMINRRQSPIADKELVEYLSTETLDLTATQDAKLAYSGADFVIVAVPTNYKCEINHFDTSIVDSVIQEVQEIAPEAIIVIKSTIPVGYTKCVREKTGSKNILFSPEFLRESKALYDNLYPSRIVVGTDLSDERLVKAAHEFAGLLQKAALKPKIDTLVMGFTEAEAVKLFANTYLALRVGYFNELDTYAELHGLDAKAIISGMCLDPRVGTDYNNPSFGYGGYCLPKDTKQLLANYEGVPQRLIGAIVETNQIRKEHIANRIMERVKGTDKPVIGVYRLAMKSGSDNFRESAVLNVMELLRSRGAEVLIYEPTVRDGETFQDYRVENDFQRFVSESGVIIANRNDELLCSVKEKVYTRDLFGSN